MSVQGTPGLMGGAGVASLPLCDPFSEAETLAIEDAIRVGVGKVMSAGVVDCRVANEIVLTEHLVSALNEMLDTLEVPGFSAEWLETIPKGGELRSYDRTHIEKRPDMSFRRQGIHQGNVNRQYCGLFVECKIVDATRTMVSYCGEGISRFVKGQYAWAMSFGMLLGYARDGYKLPGQLDRHLRTLGARYRTEGSPKSSNGATYVTIHGRPWRHLSGEDPGDITLRHMWITIA